MVEMLPCMCLFRQNKLVNGLVEFVWPCNLSCGLFVLASKPNVGKGPALLQMCSDFSPSVSMGHPKEKPPQ